MTAWELPLPAEQLVDMLTTMLRIRAFEQKVEKLFFAGEIPGFVHLYLGEEAVATGVCAALRRDDWITSTHRGHGHAIAKGARTDRMMAEIFGKRTGYCKGKGGSMHIADFDAGMLGANAVVGGGFPIAVGAGLSAKMRRTDQVAVCFFGDGASDRGTFHEALNFASVFRLPVIFVNENNQYASTTPADYAVAVKDIAARAAGYDMSGTVVDGNDVVAVYEVITAAVDRARGRGGPSLVEAKTYRWRGHFVGDPEQYRDRRTVKKWEERGPVNRLEEQSIALSILSVAEIEEIRATVDDEIAAAVRFARESPYPEPEEALEDLFTPPSEVTHA